MTSHTNRKQLSIPRLLHTEFSSLYRKLILGEQTTPEETTRLLAIAVVLANQSNIELNHLSYRIVLRYGNITSDYLPLYDISLNTGLLPVADLSKELLLINEVKPTNSQFIEEITNSFIDIFREDGILHTEQQFILNKTFSESIDSSIYVVAPTSYGKSELILSTIKNCPNRRFCILVPSKSLLAQTKKRLLDGNIGWVEKIVTHPEMHQQNLPPTVYILTQERLSRLLNTDKALSFDFLFVDEAHNLLTSDSRNELLATVITILQFRNNNCAIKYLTPFLSDTNNLNLRNAAKVDLSYKVEEYVKSERFYVADYRSNKTDAKFYDQFVNKFYDIENPYADEFRYLRGNSTAKNIVYFNRPKDIEKFVLDLIKRLPKIDHDPLVETAIEEIAVSFDKRYFLIECLSKGVVYHHGSMTDTIRHYVEYLFRNSKNLKYLISSSTLLEGVNLPIERLFLMSCRKGRGYLTPSNFKNLVGRVSRFSDVFVDNLPSNAEKLEPEVHIVASDGYISAGANLEGYLEDRAKVTKAIKDNPKNVLLESTNINDTNRANFEDAISRLENLENGIVEGYDRQYVSTDSGILLIAEGVSDINVFEHEKPIQKYLDTVPQQSISDSNTLMEVIVKGFIEYTDDSPREQLSRLKNLQAQQFYAMFFDWKIKNTPFKYMIRRMLDYWDKLESKRPDQQVYVGKWGEEPKEGGHLDHYIRMGTKSLREKINLAIVRIKEEEDFIEYMLFRYVDVLNDLELIEEKFYKLLKYGTTDERAILLIRNGFSKSVAELLLKKYSQYVDMNMNDQLVRVDPSVSSAMQANGESVLQLFEVEINTGTS